MGIGVQTNFLPDHSDPQSARHAFSYTITITNIGLLTAQLVSRHWQIIDADDLMQEVRGLGVIGQQPSLEPGEQFEYTSGCVLATPVGTMQGSYHFVAVDGTTFEAEIPSFVLSMPRTLH